MGDADGLYEGHFTNNPYGCPRFAAMTISERKSILHSTKSLRPPDPNYQSAASRFSTSTAENVATNDTSPTDGKFSNLGI